MFSEGAAGRIAKHRLTVWCRAAEGRGLRVWCTLVRGQLVGKRLAFLSEAQNLPWMRLPLMSAGVRLTCCP